MFENGQFGDFRQRIGILFEAGCRANPEAGPEEK
jgi:hypothetical protein